MSRLHLSAAVALCASIVVVTTACPSVDIPGGARIGCEADEECPSGFECREALGLCVQLGSGDRTPPTIVESTVVPESGGEGTVVVVTFTTDGPLLRAPDVVLVTAGGTRPFTVSADGDGGTGFRATITARGDDGDGVRDIRAGLVDDAGNVANDVPLGRVTLDFSRPAVAASVAPANANADTDVVVTVRTGEPVVDGSTATLVDGRAFQLDPVGDDPLVRTFRLRPTPGTDSEGDRLVDVVVQDAAGNVANAQVGVRLDFTPPAIDGEATIGRPVVAADQVATVGLRATEAIASAVVELVPEDGGAPLALTIDDLSGRDLQLRREVDADDADGVYGVRVVSLVDSAGNVAAGIDVAATLVIDQGAPTFSPTAPPTTSPTTLSRQPGNDVVTVTFTLDERADVDVRMGDVVLVCDDDGSAPAVVYTCLYGIDDGGIGAAEVDGTFVITINAVDAAGNSAFATAPSVTIDTSPPVVVVNVVPAGIARGGETVSVSAVADEALDGARLQLTATPVPPLAPTTTLAFSTPQTSGRSATSTATVPPGLEGSFTITVAAADLGGNAAAPVTTTVTIDSLAPRLVSSVLSTPRAAPGAPFAFELQASEPLARVPVVRFANGDVGVAPEAMVPVETTTTPDNRYHYTATAPRSGQNQFYTLTVVLEDVAGNSGVESPAVIVVDNAAPRLAGFDIAPLSAKAGDVVRVVVTADETLGAVPTIVARNGANTVTFVPASTAIGALSYVFTTSIGAQTPQGVWAFDAFELVDAASNRATTTTTATFSVDSVAPTVSGIAVTPAFARVSSDVRVVFETSEAVGTPAVVLDDQPMIFVAASNGNKRFEFRRTIVAADAEGLAPITISVSDAAGNVGIAGTAVEIDATRPTVLAASASPLNAKANDTIVYTVTPNEPLLQTPTLTVGGNPLALQFRTGTSFIYTARVEGSVLSGPRTVSVALTDRAGNTNTVAGDPFSIDRDVPAITAFTTTERVSRVVGRNVVTTRFTLAETTGVSVVARVGSRTSSCSNVGSAFTCTATVQATDTEGAQSVTVEATDPAGNIGVASGVTTFDFSTARVISSSIVLTPIGGAGLNTAPTAARGGTKLTVAATVDEPLDPATRPTLTVQNGTFTLVDTPATPATGPIYVFTGSVVGSPSQGLMTPQLTTTDVVGNVGTTAIGGAAFTIDTAAPPPAAVTTPDLIVSVRAPWGRSADAAANAPSVRQTIGGGPGAVTAGDIVVAYDRPDPDLPADPVFTGELGRATATPAGFTIQLGAVDVADVFLVVVDRADNVSPRVRVRDVSWTATPGNKIAGSTVENPHRFESRALNTRAIEQADALERGTGDANNLNFVFRKDNLSFSTEGLPSFTEVRSSEAATRSGLVWNTVRDVAMITGGRTGLREFDGVRWKEVVVGTAGLAGVPDISQPHRIAFDPELAQLVLVDIDGVAWFFDGVRWHAQEVNQGDIRPADRRQYALAWDPVEEALLLFGGTFDDGTNCTADNDSCSGELWRLDGLAEGWTLLDDTGPAPRQGAAMAYNFDQGAMILFGGENADGGFNDTWAWDGGWTQLPATTPPSARADAAMVHDPFFGGLVLVGGGTFSGGAVVSTAFFFDGDAWSASPIAGELPAPRGRHGLVFDEARERWLLVGGVGNGGGSCASTDSDCTDTWRGHANGWQRIAGTTSLDGLPIPRSAAAAAFDSRRGRALLFGGLAGFSANTALCATNGPCLDLWELDGATWRRRSSTSTPSARSGAAAAFDATNNVFVMFGGLSNGICDASTTTTCDGTFKLSMSDTIAGWTRLPATGTRPGARRRAAMVSDAPRARIVMVGGELSNGSPIAEHWELNAATNTWVQRCVGAPNPCGTTPGAVEGAAMAFDSLRNRTVLFGGSSSNNVFEFDGTTWRAITPVGDVPLNKFDGAMSFDPVRQRAIYTHAEACNGAVCDTWEWNGTGFTKIPAVVASPGNDGRPPQRLGHNSVYDTVRKQVLLFGGLTNVWDTWRYASAAEDAPGHAFLVDFNTAGARALSRTLNAPQPTVTSVAVTWTGSGFGFVNGLRSPGVRVVGRVDGRRRDVTSDTGDGLRTLTRTFTTGSLIDPAGHLNLWLEPLADNGTAITRGAVATDAVEVTVKYRLPD